MCFSLQWLGMVLVWALVIIGIVLILRIVIPWLLQALGLGVDARVMLIINICLVCFIVGPFLIWLVIDLASCAGGMAYPRIR